ncbi:hypothetical protein [Candidatus Pelagisphaera phototrophica]|uniref:hypothetical protein n=1 Tax=Candidatus Pelagisphaera phototrophica TaxID=2684113 RepID=UPI0024B7FCEA|nr:hypothetical protein [Candidatus Pelagisphaera phototrophica]QXD33066.1 hypothetical protein GA004_04980 [Candidatus Pelagisphaera phototrophica]
MGNGTRLFQPLGSTGRKDCSIIHANFHNIGGRRRSKFVSVDWDEGFDFDSIVGRERHGTVTAAEESGLPKPRKKAGSSLLILENKFSN